MLGLEPLLVEIEHVLDITQKYETPGFLIFTCQNANRPPQPQEGQETSANLGKKQRLNFITDLKKINLCFD